MHMSLTGHSGAALHTNIAEKVHQHQPQSCSEDCNLNEQVLYAPRWWINAACSSALLMLHTHLLR